MNKQNTGETKSNLNIGGGQHSGFGAENVGLTGENVDQLKAAQLEKEKALGQNFEIPGVSYLGSEADFKARETLNQLKDLNDEPPRHNQQF